MSGFAFESVRKYLLQYQQESMVMARASLNFAEVAAAFEKLLIQGEQPTAEKIQAVLAKGSLADVEKHLQHIFEQSRLDLVSQAEQPAAAPAAAVEVAAPTTEAAIATPAKELAVEAAAGEPNQTGRENRRFNKRDRNNNNHRNTHRVELEEPPVETPLEQLGDDQLVTKIRQLESILLKEQMRREVAERITLETKDYADSIKEQVSQRINELKQNMDVVVEQLKTQLREQKQNFDQDLKYYQEQLSKANEKLASIA